MSVRAKFVLNAVERQMGSVAKRNPDGSIATDTGGRTLYEPGEMWTIKMSPVYANGDPNHENSKFWAASPGGQLLLNCVNPGAVQQLQKLGTEFYLDITPVPTGEQP